MSSSKKGNKRLGRTSTYGVTTPPIDSGVVDREDGWTPVTKEHVLKERMLRQRAPFAEKPVVLNHGEAIQPRLPFKER